MRLRPTSVLASVAFGLVAVTALAGCGSSTPSATPPASPTNSTSPLSSPTPSPSATPTTPFQRVTATPTPATGAMDEKVTAQVRADLLAAGAAARNLKPSDFTGLRPGLTYYAYDATTHTYWAGAQLVPSSSSTQAQISAQDDGSYTLFHRSPNGAWVALDEGMAGPPAAAQMGACKVTPPADVVTIWGWPAKSCHPVNR